MTVLNLTLSGVTKPLDLASFRLSEADELKKLTGWTRDEWVPELLDDHPDAIRFAWLIANRRAGTPLEEKFTAIDFDLKDFDVEIEKADAEETVPGAEGESVPTGPPAE